MGELGTATGIANGNEAEDRARQMRLAGALFIFGSLFGLPSTLILTEVGPGLMLPFTAFGIASGVVCLLAPWERISPGWAHVVLVAAVAEVGAVALATHSSFLIYFVMIGVFVSYAFVDRRVIGAYLVLITLVLVAHGISYAGDDQAALQLAMLTIPVVLVSTAMVAYLRERQEASRLKYQRFAEEARELAARLRGQAEERQTATPAGPQIGLPATAPAAAGWDPRRVGAGLAGVVLAIPLALASLAAAGVNLPEAAGDAFEQIGISLPNQGGDPDTAGVVASPGRQIADEKQSGGGASDPGDRPGTAGRESASPGTQAQNRSNTDSGGTGQVPAYSAPPAEEAGSQGGGTAPAPAPSGPLDQALRDTIGLLDQVLPNRAPAQQPEPPAGPPAQP